MKANLKRIVAFLLALALSAPTPSYALRPTNAGMEDSSTRQRLEEELAAGMEEIGRAEVAPDHRAVIWGAGNIGRGYLAPMLARGDDFDVIFVDVSQSLIGAVNEQRTYTVIPVGSGEPYAVRNIWGIHGQDQEMVAAQGPRADWIFTAVGANRLIQLAPTIRRYIQRRIDAGRMETLNVVFAENLPIDQPQIEATRQAVIQDADEALRRYVENNVNFIGAGVVDTRFREYLDDEVGFIGAVVQITVPELRLQSKNLLDIQVEGGDYTLIVDRKELKRTRFVPSFLEPVDNVFAYREKKLLIHNMGHAVLAYLSAAKGLTDPALGMRDLEISRAVRLAMEESAAGLLAKYPREFTADQMRVYLEELLARFANQELRDTVERIGRDPLRKLSPQDRLLGAAANVLAAGLQPRAIALGIYAAIRYARLDPKITPEMLTPVLQEAQRLGLALPESDEAFRKQLAQLSAGMEEGLFKKSSASYADVIQNLLSHRVQDLDFYRDFYEAKPAFSFLSGPDNPPSGFTIADIFVIQAKRLFGEERARNQSYYLYIRRTDANPPRIYAEIVGRPEVAPEGGAGMEEVRRLERDVFLEQYADQAQYVPRDATHLLLIREGSAVTFHRPETLAEDLNSFVASQRKDLPAHLEIGLLPVPADAAQIRSPSVFFWDRGLGEPPYDPGVPLFKQWKGQPFEQSLLSLVAVALSGRLNPAEVQLLAAWAIEEEGRQVLVFAVKA